MHHYAAAVLIVYRAYLDTWPHNTTHITLDVGAYDGMGFRENQWFCQNGHMNNGGIKHIN